MSNIFRVFFYFCVMLGALAFIHYSADERLVALKENPIYKDSVTPVFQVFETEIFPIIKEQTLAIYPNAENVLQEWFGKDTSSDKLASHEAEVLSAETGVEFQAPSESGFAPLQVGSLLLKRTLISTKQGGVAEIRLRDQSTLYIDKNSLVVLGYPSTIKSNDQAVYLKVEEGAAHLSRQGAKDTPLFLVSPGGTEKLIPKNEEWIMVGPMKVEAHPEEIDATQYSGLETAEYWAAGKRSDFESIKEKLLADRRREITYLQTHLNQNAELEEQRRLSEQFGNRSPAQIGEIVPLKIPTRKEALALEPTESLDDSVENFDFPSRAPAATDDLTMAYVDARSLEGVESRMKVLLEDEKCSEANVLVDEFERQYGSLQVSDVQLLRSRLREVYSKTCQGE